MTARKRKENESFTTYRANLKKEAHAEKHRKGILRWNALWGPYIRRYMGELRGAAGMHATLVAAKAKYGSAP